YVLHHAQDVQLVLNEIIRTLRHGGCVVVYEDMPDTWFDRAVCWSHNLQWRYRTGPCTFRKHSEWRELFQSFGFTIVDTRALSRWRNLSHPVRRRLYVLKYLDHGRSARGREGLLAPAQVALAFSHKERFKPKSTLNANAS